LIPKHFRENKENVLVIYTPAVPKNHSELLYFEEHNFVIKKRAEVLGLISRSMRCIAIAGTHGKTTTSSMVAHILRNSGVDCAAFLGGITQNYNTNLLINESQGENTFVVVEADEYDRSFLQLFPEIAVITSTDADHLDIYGDAQEVQNTYSKFGEQVEKLLFISENVVLNENITLKASLVNYKLIHETQKNYNKKQEVYAKNIHVDLVKSRFVFDYVYKDLIIRDIALLIPGFHNVENATAAISVALQIGISPEKIKTALGNFGGVKRRFQYIIETPTCVQLDDYAHHPTEVEAFLVSLRTLYPNRHITVVFQPHLFSRTQDFYRDFAEKFSLVNRLVLLPIYPARELQEDFPTTSSKNILDLALLRDKHIVEYQDVISFLADKEIDIIATIGAGNVEGLILPIKEMLEKK
jgi:UDP-N-acetylmuramate--alanine ligase